MAIQDKTNLWTWLFGDDEIQKRTPELLRDGEIILGYASAILIAAIAWWLTAQTVWGWYEIRSRRIRLMETCIQHRPFNDCFYAFEMKREPKIAPWR